ncbi:hypothetical protein [Candidatus Thiodiazotropha sp. LNASS1]|uniref:hypothetical protein n=1 Tax=Candidatus Thiodiazotropha sp. LNASS1 TaxID=3096260 RepID=UPI0034DF82DD
MWRFQGIEPFRASERGGPFDHHLESLRDAPRPHGQVGDFSSPPWNPHRQRACHSPLDPSTNRPPLGCRERFSAQSRPLLRQVDDDQGGVLGCGY